MAARVRIVILSQDVNNPLIYSYLLWADVPVSRQQFYAKPTGTLSVWKQALPSDNSQLVSGAVTEQVSNIQTEATWDIMRLRSELETRWRTFQDEINANNPWSRYGSTWNGTNWTIVTVA